MEVSQEMDGESSRDVSDAAINEMSDKDSEEQTGASLSSSSASSPLPVDDLGPVFEVKGIRAAADSSVLTFKVNRLDDPENREDWWEITRNYDDFDAFSCSLPGSQKFEGVIFPPLPPPMHSKFDDTFQEAALIHRKQLERYLQLVCSHPILGRSQALADFLSPTYAGIPDRAGRKGLFAKLAASFASSSQPSKVPMHDIEEFFQNERDWANNYSAHLKTVLNAVLTVVHVEKKITGQLKHLCTALTMSSPSYPPTTSLVHYQLHSKMAEAFLNIEDLIEESLQRGMCDFYCIWDLYHQFVTSEQLMLNRRAALLISYEHANRNFDRSKPHKKDEAEVVKKAAETAFEECSDTARHEIKGFHKQRVQEMRSTLTQLARSELQRARQIREALGRTLEQARLFPVESSADDQRV